MKRAALWLVQEVGTGGLFTKEQLREAFQGTSQIDRRMRDLRKFGWQIDTNREDPTLEAHEHRFTSEGEPVWQEGKGSQPGNSVSTVQRRELLARDGHKCRSCGISTGETYPGTYHASQLDIARRPVLLPSGAVEVQHVIECSRCRVGGLNLTADLAGVLARIERLPLLERKMLAGWVERDARVFSEVEDIWAAYRSLPADSRDQVRDALS
nr:hypothetical protein [Kitasatospora sp. SID7827]